MTNEDHNLRELARLKAIARHALDVVGSASDALHKAIDAPDIECAASHLRGSASTFARGLLHLVTLA